MEKAKKVVVIGVGNLLLKDEGVGIHIAHTLQRLKMPDGVEIIDGGTSPDLPAYFDEADRLIIIDAVKAGGKPGIIYRLHPDDLTPEAEGAISVHQLGLEQSLKMMGLMRNKPKEIVIIGIEPKEIDWGTKLSTELERRVPEIIKVVVDEISSGSRVR